MARPEHVPVVSIGMPVFNGERFLDEALRSLLSQTFVDFELVISDNASTDATAEICARHARSDPRVRYVRQASNLGALANFQQVLDLARGRYFMWAACDDFWSRDWIECLHAELEHGDVQAGFGQVQHVDVWSQPLAHIASDRDLACRGVRIVRRLKYFVAFEGAGKANVFYGLFERRVLAGLQVQAFAYDYHLVFHALARTELAGVPGIHLYKRIHADAASERMVQQRGLVHRLLLRTVLPVDAALLRGYFAQAGLGERLLLAAALPLKYLCAYPYMLQRLRGALGAALKRTADRAGP